MYFVIVDTEGASLDSFTDEAVARSALRAMVDADPGLEHEVLLLAYSDEGEPVGEAAAFEDIASEVSTPQGTIADAVMSGGSGIPSATAALGYAIYAPLAARARTNIPA